MKYKVELEVETPTNQKPNNWHVYCDCPGSYGATQVNIVSIAPMVETGDFFWAMDKIRDGFTVKYDSKVYCRFKLKNNKIYYQTDVTGWEPANAIATNCLFEVAE